MERTADSDRIDRILDQMVEDWKKSHPGVGSDVASVAAVWLWSRLVVRAVASEKGSRRDVAILASRVQERVQENIQRFSPEVDQWLHQLLMLTQASEFRRATLVLLKPT